MLTKHTSSTQPSSTPQKIILVVEDDQDIGCLLEEILSCEEGLQVIVVTEGKQALQLVQHLPPHLILLDYQLPDIDGLKLYDRLQDNGVLKHIPVVLMSANLPRRELAKRRLIGLEKPFDIDVVLRTINHLLALGVQGFSPGGVWGVPS